MKNPCRQWELVTITNIMHCCIILHNMIIHDEQGQDLEPIFYQAVASGSMLRDLTFRELNVGTWELENFHIHFALRNDIIEHLWKIRGENRY